MWFLTVDPFIRISVFIAKLSKRQYCWRVFEDFNCQEYIQFFDVNCGFSMRLHFYIGCNDCRWISRHRQSIHFSSTQVLFCWSTFRSPQQILKFKIRWRREAPIFRRWEDCCFTLLLWFQESLWPASTLLHGHIALAIPSLLWTNPQNLEHWGYADEDHSGKSFQAKDFGLECQHDVRRLWWIEHIGSVSVCSSPYLENTQPTSRVVFWNLFARLISNLAMRIWALFS